MEEKFPGQESEAFPLVLALPFTCWVTSDSSFYLAHPRRGVTNMQCAEDNGSRAPVVLAACRGHHQEEGAGLPSQRPHSLC